jgi:hypothetical protein
MLSRESVRLATIRREKGPLMIDTFTIDGLGH